MLKLISIIAAVLVSGSIYSYQVNTIAGKTISFSSFQHKKILLVNIATGSNHVDQLSGLQELYQTYGDSLAIIAFPSNSFGNETRNDPAIRIFCEMQHHTTFPIAVTRAVNGSQAQPVFQWLANGLQNGTADAPALGDFSKWLISEEGRLVATFSPAVKPTDSVVIAAITKRYEP